MVHRVTVTGMLARLLAVVASLGAAAGCYRPPEPDCGFVCGPGGACPADYTCTAQNVCRRNGASGPACPGAPDAAPAPIDAPAADAFPPVHLISVSPADGATGVAVDSPVIATVDEDLIGYSTTSFTVFGGAVTHTVAGVVDYVAADHQLRFTPTEQYDPNATYTAKITSDITNVAGFPLGPHQWSFTTGADQLAPRVIATDPADSSTQVATDTHILVRFDEPVTGVDATSYTVSDGTNAIAGTVTASLQEDFTFVPDAALPSGATITVSLSAAIQDASGNALVPTSVSFTTQ